MAEALPLFDRALAVTESDPALTDLRLLLQLNKAVTLGNLDRHEEALAAAGQARQLADQVGATFRLAQATAPWVSCCSRAGDGTTRWPRWATRPRT